MKKSLKAPFVPTADQVARTKLMIRGFQLKVLQAEYEAKLRTQIILNSSFDNLLDPEDPLHPGVLNIKPVSGWEEANVELWKNYAILMTMIEDNQDKDAILFNRIITA